MSILAVISVGKDHHLIPIKETDRHVTTDTLYCCCAPTATMDETDPEFPLTIHHVSLAWRKWGHRTFSP